MCFIKEKENFLHKIAEHDIICYKVVIENNGEFRSFYEGFPYELGRYYSMDLRDYRVLLHDRYFSLGANVYHSYMCGCDHYAIAREIDSFVVRRAHGVDFYPDEKVCVVQCTIPEGSIYWVNQKLGEYCSSDIRLDKVIFSR